MLSEQERGHAYEHFDATDTHMGRCYLEEDVERIIADREVEAGRQALRDAADELWRVFLRLPHTPSPLGDYIQRRVIELRARADGLGGAQ